MQFAAVFIQNQFTNIAFPALPTLSLQNYEALNTSRDFFEFFNVDTPYLTPFINM